MIINKIKEKILRTVKTYRTNRNVTKNEAIQIISTTENSVLIDVRSVQEYKEYHIDGAICIPYFEIQNKIEEVVTDKNAIIIVYCKSGIRSKKAVEILERKGYNNVYSIKNGLDG